MKKYHEIGDADKIVVSNSSMSEINPEEGGSPRKFIDFFKRVDKQEKSYFRIGNAVDKYVQFPDTYTQFIEVSGTRPTDGWVNLAEEMIRIEDAVQDNNFNTLILAARQNLDFQSRWNPDTVISKFIDEGGKDYFDFLKRSAGKIILTQDEKMKFDSCIESLRANKYANEYLFNKEISIKQAAIYFRHTVTIKVKGEDVKVELLCKCLLDQLILDNNMPCFMVNDLKTTGKAISLFEKSFEQYRYYRQLSFYILAVQYWLMGKATMVDDSTGDKIEMTFKPPANCKFYANIIAVETENYNTCEIFPIKFNSGWLTKGTREYTSLLERIAWHQYTGEWFIDRDVFNASGQRFLKEPDNI